jgi:hypothetical protein
MRHTAFNVLKVPLLLSKRPLLDSLPPVTGTGVGVGTSRVLEASVVGSGVGVRGGAVSRMAVGATVVVGLLVARVG